MLFIFVFQQSKELNISRIPNVYFIRKDCLVVEQWPITEDIKTSGREVIVDALCAAAVLRGAHVFAPGVIGLPPSEILLSLFQNKKKLFVTLILIKFDTCKSKI